MALSKPVTGLPDSQITTLAKIDQWKPIDNIRTLVFFIVRQSLNEDVLRTSLDRLIRHHLPILGARIKPTGKNGALEYHQPKAFADGYALFKWSGVAVQSKLGEFLRLLDTSRPKEAIISDSSVPEIEAKLIPSGWPVERKYERPDSPLLFVHLIHYNDATVVEMNLPHAVADMMGFASVVRAWMQVVRNEVPTPFLELVPGALDGPADLPVADLRKKGSFRLTSKMDRLQVAGGFAPEIIKQPKEDRRTLFFPTPVIDALRTRLDKSLKAKHGPETPSLTNGDILSGLIVKLNNLHRKSPKMLSLSEAITLRGRHPALPSERPYLHNAIAFSVARLFISRETPLEEIAYRHQLALTEAKNPANIDRSLAVTREMFNTGQSIHICEPFQLSHSVTNWTGAWREIDFSAAAANSGTESTGTANGTTAQAPPLVIGHALERGGTPCRFNTQIMCKAEGGYWCDFATSKKNMALIKKFFKSDPSLQTLADQQTDIELA